MRTLDQITTDIKAAKKVTRLDIYEILEAYGNQTDEEVNVRNFLKSVGEISDEDIDKVLDDLLSYPVTYRHD